MIQDLKFDEHGLIPAIVQDDATNEVLMIAYMNAESMARTLQTGETWFWSRSRQELWRKGATSGHTQQVLDLRVDCDGDALLLRVKPNGPACHTGERTCFFRNTDETGSKLKPLAPAPVEEKRIEAPISPSLSVVNLGAMNLGILLQDLYTLIGERKDQRPEGSYTSYLFNSGLDKILKKVGEESAETIIAAKNDDRKQLSAEISDLLYHLLVLMAERDVSLEDILNELGHRAGKTPDPKYSTRG
jgi:phosphoribosyl-AMP cyclohydrolase / phosphoribosyl-ATP pyrophosphohydrolase